MPNSLNLGVSGINISILFHLDDDVEEILFLWADYERLKDCCLILSVSSSILLINTFLHTFGEIPDQVRDDGRSG